MIRLTPELVGRLKQAGVECFSTGRIPRNTTLEPPCSLKWMVADHSLSLGAFSYAVRGYYFHVSIGRYTSIGEDVQVGRGDHPTRWMSTSPAFYLPEPIFDVGDGFPAAKEYHQFRPTLRPGVPPTVLKKTVIGNDVYIGHGAFIRPGVTIGNGAVVGAYAVVVKDVPPYAVVAGNPATIKKFRVPFELIGPLLRLAWWRFAPWQLTQVDVTQPAEAVKALAKLAPTLEPYSPPRILMQEFAATAEQAQPRGTAA